MLASDSSVEELMASPQADEREGFLLREDAEADDLDPWLGQILGPFQLEKMLGRGGMGVVYLARRISGGFNQSVAIKLIARHLSTGPAVRQFNLERDALARLEHKNIARLLDAGVTAEGTPFVAMEYIEGQRLDEVCDDPSVSLEEKLRLIVQLCDAVTYVHRNLILHRDLKPGNVMVTDEGLVKLLDFGTVKLLGPAADTNSEMTQLGMRPMTLRYASPEHIEGKVISTSADVYSLGMILYRVVAGRLPEAVSGLSVEEYVRQLRDAPIRPPSEVRNSAKQPMDKDLDAIVMKAIRFEPEKRYGSGDELAADILRCLQQRPVAARRGTWRYRAATYYRRNRWPVLTAAAVSVVLAAGLVLMRQQAGAARKEQQRAEAGIERERGLAHFLFKDYFDQLKLIPGSTDAQRTAVAEALSYLDRLSIIANSEGLRLDTAEAYRRLALLQGDPYEQNLGDPHGALKSLEKAQAIAASLNPATRSSPAVLSVLALVERTRSEVVYGLGQTQDAVAAMRSAVGIYDEIVANPAATVAQLQYASNAYNGLADELGQPESSSLGDTAGALSAYRHDIELSERALKIDPASVLSRQSIALAHDKIGQLLVSTDPMAAIEAFRRSLADRDMVALSVRNAFRSRRGKAVNLMDLGDALTAARDYKPAQSAFDEARATLEAFVAADPKDVRAKHDVAVVLTQQAAACIDQLNPNLAAPDASAMRANQRQAIDLLQRSVDILEHIAAADTSPLPWRVLLAYNKVMLGSLKFSTHQDPGGKLAAEGLVELRKFGTLANLSIEELTWVTEGEISAQPARLRDAALSVKYAERLTTLDHRSNPETLLLLAQAYRSVGDFRKANDVARQGLAMLAPIDARQRVPRTRKLLEIETHSAP
jgi:non-specific serine/threonine protein kinase/serine/threonine-protein kinase